MHACMHAHIQTDTYVCIFITGTKPGESDSQQPVQVSKHTANSISKSSEAASVSQGTANMAAAPISGANVTSGGATSPPATALAAATAATAARPSSQEPGQASSVRVASSVTKQDASRPEIAAAAKELAAGGAAAYAVSSGSTPGRQQPEKSQDVSTVKLPGTQRLERSTHFDASAQKTSVAPVASSSFTKSPGLVTKSGAQAAASSHEKGQMDGLEGVRQVDSDSANMPNVLKAAADEKESGADAASARKEAYARKREENNAAMTMEGLIEAARMQQMKDKVTAVRHSFRCILGSGYKPFSRMHVCVYVHTRIHTYARTKMRMRTCRCRGTLLPTTLCQDTKVICN
jgi:hypothetical protein